MPRGSAPGERRGGRIKGVPNKSTLARAAEIASVAKKIGLPLAIQHIEDGMHRYVSLAAQFQKGGPQENIKEFEHYFDKAMKLAIQLANYQSPKLQSTTISVDPIDLTQLTDVEIAFLERLRAKSASAGIVESGESQTTH